ncbi:MAG: radical SAM protein, partial [Mucinivorans sp.]
PRQFNDRTEVQHELERTLRQLVAAGTPPDVITFAGNGEPTMHPEFAAIIDDTLALRDAHCPSAKVSVLSNATRCGLPEVRQALLKVDNNILKLDSAFDETVRMINNPGGHYTVAEVVDNMLLFDGKLIIQSMFLRGEHNGQRIDNTTPRELTAWLACIARIRPAQVMVYSL